LGRGHSAIGSSVELDSVWMQLSNRRLPGIALVFIVTRNIGLPAVLMSEQKMI
jgi:hypothetical protein